MLSWLATKEKTCVTPYEFVTARDTFTSHGRTMALILLVDSKLSPQFLPSDVHLHGLQRCQALCTIGCQPSAMRVPMGKGKHQAPEMISGASTFPLFSMIQGLATTQQLFIFKIENLRSLHGSPPKKKTQSALSVYSQVSHQLGK